MRILLNITKKSGSKCIWVFSVLMLREYPKFANLAEGQSDLPFTRGKAEGFNLLNKKNM